MIDNKKNVSDILKDARKIVVKIGGRLLLDLSGSKAVIQKKRLIALAKDILALQRQGKKICLVISGAIQVGFDLMGPLSQEEKLQIENKQAAFSIGQVELMKVLQTFFQKYKVPIAQILLTHDDIDARRRHLNARASIQSLLDRDIVPIINENSSIATHEIREGDNDILSAGVAQMMSADLLIILSSQIKGFYQKDPFFNKNASLYHTVETITKSIERSAQPNSLNPSAGGMKTKIEAAKIATRAGVFVLMTDGRDNHVLETLFTKPHLKDYSLFLTPKSPEKARQDWIASHMITSGAIYIDDEAQDLLKKGGDISPQHVLKINGIFQRGDLISICNENGDEIGRGLSAFCWKDAIKIHGKDHSHKIKELGFSGRNAIIDRDNLILMQPASPALEVSH